MARLGRNLNQTEAARVDTLLKDGSAIIRRFARSSFMQVSKYTMTVRADAGIIVVPKLPVISIDGLVAKSGISGVPDIPVVWYRFDGISEILVPAPAYSGVINLPAYWYQTIWTRQSFDLTWSFGYSATPPEVEALLCNSIISELATPTMSATLQSEVIGAYSYSMRRNMSRSSSTSGAPPMAGLYATLMDFGMQSLLADYRRSHGTIGVRF